MNAPELVAGEPLQGFAGEQRTLPEHLLPGNVSPDALNIDYRDGTLRKRGGISRLGSVPALQGGVRFNRFFTGTAYGRGYARSDTTLTLSASLQTYNFLVSSTWVSVGGDVRCFFHQTSGGVGTGLWLKNDAGTYRWEARCVHSGGTLAVTAVAAASNDLGSFTLVQLSFNTSTKTLALVVDGVSASGTLGANTYTQPASYIYLAAVSTEDYDKQFIISQVRIWDGTVAALLSSPYRNLTSAERTSALKVWWNMASVENSAMANVVSGPALNLFGISVDVSVGAVLNTQSTDLIEAIVTQPLAASGVLYTYARTRRALYYGVFGHPLSQCLALQGTDGLGITGSGPRSFHGQLLPYFGYVVALNGVGENLAEGNQLSYDAPVMSSGLTITAAGAASGSVNAGSHSYLFSIYNSTTGVESAVGLEISTQTAAASDKFTIDFTSGGFMPSRYYLGADKIRIYRTEAAAAVFYFVADVAIDATSYEDSASDASIAVSSGRLNPYLGYAAPSRFGFEMDDRLWLGNQDGFESRLVYTEKFALGAFYVDNYVDVGAGDGDSLTGGIGVGGQAVVFKRRSSWLVSSAGGAVQVQRIFPGVGCVQHATIAVSHDTVYFLGEGGVYAMPLPLGSAAPVNLTLSGWREFFVDLRSFDREIATAVWDAINERYILSFNLATGRVVLVYCARSQAWAQWDTGYVSIDAFCATEGDDFKPVLLCGYGPWVGRFEEGLSDADYVEGASPRLAGTVTGATSTTLTDSGANWGVDMFFGLYVMVTSPDGTQSEQKFLIGNTATELQVASWAVTPSAGWTYMLGAIEGRWRSPKMGLDRWDRDKRIDQVRLLNVLPSAVSGDVSTGIFVADDRDEETFLNSADARLVPFAPQYGACREVSVGIRQTSSVETFEVGGVALVVEQEDGT